MRFSNKLLIDHYLGRIFILSLYLPTRLLGIILQRNHSLKEEPRRIVFLKFVGMGSVSRASFILAGIRKKWPQCEIVFCSFAECSQLVRLYPCVDRVIRIRDTSLTELVIDTLKAIVSLWSLRRTWVIDLEVHSKYSTLFSLLSAARNRIGYSNVASRFRRGLYTHAIYWNLCRHVDASYAALATLLDIPNDRTPIPPRTRTDSDRQLARVLAEAGIGEKCRLVGVNPNAGQLSQLRRWPIENFAHALCALPQDPGTAVVWIGSPSDRTYVSSAEPLLRMQNRTLVNLAGRLDFEMLICLIRRLSLLVTNDSGPLHLADALGIQTVSIWGPTRPDIYGPRGSRHRYVYTEIFCSPCLHLAEEPPCGGDNQCLKRIAWQPVAAMILESLGYPVPAHLRLPDPPGQPGEAHFIPGHWSRRKD